MMIRYMMKRKKRIMTPIAAVIAVLMLLAASVLTGCDSISSMLGIGSARPDASTPGASAADTSGPGNTFPVDDDGIPMATAPGTNVAESDKAVIDFSNAHDGYIMAKFRKNTDRGVRAVVLVPDGTQYTYRLAPGGDYEVLPLTGGNGEYTFSVVEQVEGEDTRYALVVTATVDVVLTDEFAPFLRPNQFVNYNRNSVAVRKATELTAGIDGFMETVAAVYNFVITNIVYDKELAETVQSGYLPDLDAVLVKGKGICFDYAAVMTAMLRSQGIPTRMVFGYTGEDYHAWISVFAEETGWVDDVIFFDGDSWQLMDPTFASSGQSSMVAEYIGDGSNYTARFMY